jgi:hypothetical protein
VSRKLVLAVVDGMAPAAVRRAIDTGQAPVLAELARRGSGVLEAVAAFPSVTPVCAASIATGVRQDRHRIPSMNWWSRDEGRYVEYGSSFSAARRFGVVQQLTDTVYNMNHEHLPADVPTVFEQLDDAGLRTAGTTYLMYRGRHEHRPARDTPLARVAGTVMRRPVMGPRELFYADLYASRDTGCRSMLGLPGVRDQHAGCVGAHLVEHDLFDFLLLSLPDNDTHSHEHGPDGQVASIAHADRQLERLVHAGGGIDAFLDAHAVVVVADHSHAPVEATVDLAAAFADFAVAGPGGVRKAHAELALCPAQRAAMVYVLVEEGRRELVPRVVSTARCVEGVDLVLWRPAPREGALARLDRELRFAPGGDLLDPRGRRWSVEGDPGLLGLEVQDGVLVGEEYPDALARAWSALTCPTSGDVLLSAAPGREFPDWGGVDHVGGGSHGSLHRSDSLGALLHCGLDGGPAPPGGWSIADVTPRVVAHFGVAGG